LGEKRNDREARNLGLRKSRGRLKDLQVEIELTWGGSLTVDRGKNDIERGRGNRHK